MIVGDKAKFYRRVDSQWLRKTVSTIPPLFRLKWVDNCCIAVPKVVDLPKKKKKKNRKEGKYI